MLHRSNVYDRQILADLLQNFIHEISRDCFAVQYIVSWTVVSWYDETRDLVTPLSATIIRLSIYILAPPPKDYLPNMATVSWQLGWPYYRGLLCSYLVQGSVS